MSDGAVLRTRNLRKRFKSGFTRHLEVLRGLDLSVAAGEVYGLLGRNGAGKSTAFRILTGLSRPDGGTVTVLGGRPGERDVQLRVGYCPESPQFPPHLTVDEVLSFHSALVKPRLITMGNRKDWLIEQFDLGPYRRRLTRQLSRGGAQRLALALALLARPELLILDEPLTALDPYQRQRIIDVLKDQHCAGTAMIVSSHILAELECLCDRLGVLKQGRIEREFALNQDDAVRRIDIRIPAVEGKELRLDESDLEVLREGDSQTVRGVPFDRAQDLLRQWSAAGVPILEFQAQRPLSEADILADFAEDDAPEQRELQGGRT